MFRFEKTNIHNLKDLSETFHRDKIALAVLAIGIFSVLFAIKDASTYRWFKAIAGMGILSVLFLQKKPTIKPIFWLILLGYHTPLLFKNMYYVANHYFVLLYAMIAIIIFVSSLQNTHRLAFHFRVILAAVMIFGGLHKLLEPSYTNGAFFMYQIDMGVFLQPFKSVFSDWKVATQQNVMIHKQIQLVDPGIMVEKPLLAPVSPLRTIALIFGWGAIIMELTAGVLIALWPKRLFTHFVLTLTIVSVFVFRLETGFLSLLAAMALVLSPNRQFSVAYGLLFILFISFLVSGIGLK